MNERFLLRLARIEPRLIVLIMGSLLAVLALQGWLLVLRGPVSDLRRLHGQRVALAAPRAQASHLESQIGGLEAQVAVLTNKLRGQEAHTSVDQMVVGLIGRLDRIAERRGVHLDSVRPGATRRVLMFDEVSSDIKLTGDYRALFGWLRDAEQEPGPLAVTEFSINSAEAGSGVLSMDLKLAAYRPAAAGNAMQ